MESLFSIHTALCLIYSTHKNKYIKDIPVYIFSYNLCCFFISIFFTSQQEIKLHRRRNVLFFLQRKRVFPLITKRNWKYITEETHHTYFMFKFYIWKSHLLIHCVSSVMQQFPLNWSFPSGRGGGKLIKPGEKENLRRQREQKFRRFTNLLLKVKRRVNTY